jgi:hypothetical protein
MKTIKPARRKPSPDTVAAALTQLDVHCVTWTGKVSGVRLAKRPAALLASLAEQDEARLRPGIIPLLLRHPDLATVVPEAIKQVSPRRRNVLKLYYTAALLLQQKYAARLKQFLGQSAPLTDWYSIELGVPIRGDPDTRLRILARQQRERSGLALNWLGTYEHAAERFLRHLEFHELDRINRRADALNAEAVDVIDYQTNCV